jgi:uncharacterized membrane protein
MTHDDDPADRDGQASPVARVWRDARAWRGERAGLGGRVWRGALTGLGGRAWGGDPLVKAGSLEFERVLFFSDAVFAIAITLLVVDLRVPVSATIQAAHLLRTDIRGMVGFGIGFGVIGLYWLGHHALYRRITAMNGPLIRLNLLFLGTIAFLPYPTALLSGTSSDQVASVVFYAAWVAAVGLTEAAIWFYALRIPGLVSADLTTRQRRDAGLRILVAPVVFLVSIPVALAAPGPAQYVWILVWILGLAVDRRVRESKEMRTATRGTRRPHDEAT